jgi:dUTP pyrophosphatase
MLDLFFGAQNHEDTTAQSNEDTSRIISQELDYYQQHCAYIIRKPQITPFPIKGSPGAAGYNVYCIQETTVPAGDQMLLQLGLRVKPPLGCYTRLASRSGLSLHYRLLANRGVINQDYTGNISLLMFNHSKTDDVLSQGDRIGQSIFEHFNPLSLWRSILFQKLNEVRAAEVQACSQLQLLKRSCYTQDCSINGWKKIALHLHLLYILQR